MSNRPPESPDEVEADPQSLCAEDLSHIYPFYAWVDAELVLRQQGRSLAKADSRLTAGTPIFAVLNLIRPRLKDVSLARIKERNPGVIMARSDSGFLLRGVPRFRADQSGMFILFEPSVTSREEFRTLGLAMDDLPPGHLLPDLLLLLGQRDRSLEEIEGIAAELEAKATDLERAKDRANQAALSKDRFLTMMSHELQTPIHGIIGLANALEANLTDGAAKEDLGRLIGCANHLGRQVGQLLDFTKLQAGSLVPRSEPVNTRQLSDQLIQAFVGAAEAKQIEISTLMAPDVPSDVLGDEQRLYQVLSHLLDNALSFTTKGRVTLEVSVAGTREAPKLQFAVRDTGCGIAEESQDAIFHAFEQVERGLDRTHEGSGLGLSISKQLVCLMGGVLSVQSKLNEGSCFSFALPLQSIAAPCNGTNSCSLQHRRVLVVDDNKVNRVVAKKLLESLGCEVDLAEGGLGAVECWQSLRIDAVLMDIQMPDLDGVEATKRIRRLEHEQGEAAIPIVAFTAHDTKEDRDRCFQAGMDDYLVKPLKKEVLCRTLESAITPRSE